MEVIKSFTGRWYMSILGPLDTVETISILRCDDRYIVLQVLDIRDSDSVSSTSTCTKNYQEALEIWERLYKDLMVSMNC